MGTDGTFNPAATYVEALYNDGNIVSVPHRVTGSSNPVGVTSKMISKTYGVPTANGKFTEVEQGGDVVYTESHPNRFPML